MCCLLNIIVGGFRSEAQQRYDASVAASLRSRGALLPPAAAGRLRSARCCDTNKLMPTHPHSPAPLPPGLSHIRRSLAGTRLPEREENTHAAVALVLAGDASDLCVCLIRRAEHELDRWSGHVALPGGRVDPIDLGPREAAIRETREEV